MKQENQQILLPGGFKQFRILKSKYDISAKDVLIIGSNSEKIAEKMIENEAKSVKIVVNDYDSLMNSRLNLDKDSNILIIQISGMKSLILFMHKPQYHLPTEIKLLKK